jgi:hypothetical protein
MQDYNLAVPQQLQRFNSTHVRIHQHTHFYGKMYKNAHALNSGKDPETMESNDVVFFVVERDGKRFCRMEEGTASGSINVDPDANPSRAGSDIVADYSDMHETLQAALAQLNPESPAAQRLFQHVENKHYEVSYRKVVPIFDEAAHPQARILIWTKLTRV